MSRRRVDVVIVAAGRGSRFGSGVAKQFLPLAGEPVLGWSIRAFRSSSAVREVVVVLPEKIAEAPPAWIRAGADRWVAGARTRSGSVAAGLGELRTDCDRVMVHDGVRPFVRPDLIGRLVEVSARGPAIPILPLTDTIKRLEDGRVERTLDRSRLGRAQTPQIFPAELLRSLYAASSAEPGAYTDDASLCEAAGIEVRSVPGDPYNLKITTPADLEYARWLIERGRVERH